MCRAAFARRGPRLTSISDAGADDTDVVQRSGDHDASACARPASACEAEHDGWFAMRTTLDAWWQGEPLRDPGRANIEVYLLARLSSCKGEPTRVKMCGLELPVQTSDVSCAAMRLELDDSIWDRPRP